jgi:hypothetical protein
MRIPHIQRGGNNSFFFHSSSPQMDQTYQKKNSPIPSFHLTHLMPIKIHSSAGGFCVDILLGFTVDFRYMTFFDEASSSLSLSILSLLDMMNSHRVVKNG